MEDDDFVIALHNAILNNEFVLYYQPCICLTTDKIVGFEALIRWVRPGRGIVPPAEFIPMAEETGQIARIGEWVIREACQQLKRWEDHGISGIRVAVNCSASQFQDCELADFVQRILAETGVSGECLELEITERVLLNPVEMNIRALRQLNRLGIKIALDDFGTGYSSLSYLKQFSIQTLKIDRIFISGLPDNPEDASITHAIIDLAHHLGISVVAEGVEREEQSVFLRNHKCDYAQGYWYSKPLPPDEIIELLHAKRWLTNAFINRGRAGSNLRTITSGAI
jgi:EAL domain-containing protein (putative c-di-GMP-specific phosphodiesterase class I)